MDISQLCGSDQHTLYYLVNKGPGNDHKVKAARVPVPAPRCPTGPPQGTGTPGVHASMD